MTTMQPTTKLPAPATSLLRLRAVAAGNNRSRLLKRYCAIGDRGPRSFRIQAWRDYEAAVAHEARAFSSLFASSTFSAPLYSAPHMEGR